MSDISLKNFVGGAHCLIVEPSSSFSANILNALQEQGIPFSQMLTARRFQEAKRYIEEVKPKFVIMEYDLPDGHALALVDIIEKQCPDSERIVFVVTKNSSDSAIAEAAEGSVDAFVLKPFSIVSFKQKMDEILKKKAEPSPYSLKIFEGRTALSAKEYEKALSVFREAKPMNPSPSMACFYAGEVLQAMGKKDEALREYQEGRKYNSIHYKCLIREFEVLMDQKKYDEAYPLVSLLKENYPISSNRLGQIFVAAVYSKHFDDIASLYELFLAVDNRTPQLIELTALALFTAGRYMTKKKDLEKATQFFELGISVKARELVFIEKVINELLKENAVEAADYFLTLALPSDVGSRTFNGLKFKVERHNLPPEKVIERGRKLVSENQATPEIYLLVIESLVTSNKMLVAEGVVAKALMEYPEMRTELYQILEKKSA